MVFAAVACCAAILVLSLRAELTQSCAFAAGMFGLAAAASETSERVSIVADCLLLALYKVC